MVVGMREVEGVREVAGRGGDGEKEEKKREEERKRVRTKCRQSGSF